MMWLCLVASFVFIIAAIVAMSERGDPRSKIRNKLAWMFFILAQVSFWAAAWFGNKPEWLDPY